MSKRQGLQTVNNTKVSVLASSTLVLAANSDREMFSLTNDSDEVMYVSINGDGETAAAVMNEGEPLYPAQTMSMEYPIIFYGAIYAICASGTKNLAVVEAS
tara:strand:+ start:5317 stop:5619 length:303 start_codon:yes stop_codon:yes gene_type:complete